MTTTIRRRRLAGAIAIAVPIAVVALGFAAWNDAGKQPVEDLTIEVPLPKEAAR
ncbi:hypothetical protein [Novosphingobium sp. AP12]|uniref:hypothetical protein n=1 Tax=Novosphingobium sp. AP12 TaxID=1144305 RepID=UPI0002721EB4|nr:hypothetical protein [Novosphingobium sp. AP12]EJL32196.1 hypothetical protein PMI02_01576 [Novosphingobium sp. AP12]